MFFDEVEKESYDLIEEPVLPRFRKIPRRYDDESTPHHYQTPKDQYRHIYFEVLEVIAGEIERTFDQPDLKTIKDVEQLVINASEKFDINDRILKHFENDIIDCVRLINASRFN